MPPEEPGLAPVIRLPLKRRPTPEQEVQRERLVLARLQARKLRRLKLKVVLAGAVLVGMLGAGLVMAVDSTDLEGGTLTSEDAASDAEASPFAPASGGGDDTSAGSAWFSTSGSGSRGR
jgi:hypothetical protein